LHPEKTLKTAPEIKQEGSARKLPIKKNNNNNFLGFRLLFFSVKDYQEFQIFQILQFLD
jgi:hypothetical protein